MKTTGLTHFAIRVTDLARAATFYGETLGFEKIRELPGVVLFSLPGGSLLGVLGDSADTPDGDRFNPHRVGLDHLALGVPDEAALSRLLGELDAADVPNNGIEMDEVLGSPYVSFYDPDGIAWELFVVTG